ncbi:MAG: phage portal protein [Tepidisphaeraceae bacterium]|jgi:hypothetical protein
MPTAVPNWNPPALAAALGARPRGNNAAALAPIGKSAPSQNRPAIKAARFDNQLTTEENRELWAFSDLLSVDAQANFMVRRTLRMRGRYAYHNNPFMMGASNRLSKFVIGSGPRLHMASDNDNYNDVLEARFARWAREVKLARKLRTSRTARCYNGEGFNLLRTNPKIKDPVKLDVFEIEADQVSSPLFGLLPAQFPDQWFDGVVLDPWGNPEVYHVLRQHPGAFGAFIVMGYEYDPWPARYVLHDFARMRPAQQRGIPEFTPALDLLEEARRFRKAVQAAAETAADWVGSIETLEAAAGNTALGEGESVPVRRRSLRVMPQGYTMKMNKSEQPTQTYSDYILSLLVEASQILDMPLFIMTGDARLANMSSAYVATQSFIKSVQTDRDEYGILLDKIFDEWHAEAKRIPGFLPKDEPDNLDHSWRWDRISKHADPQKMAQSIRLELQNGKAPSIVYSDEGLDFDENVARGAADYGVTDSEFRASLFQSIMAQRGNPPPISEQPGTGSDNAPDQDPNELNEEGEE